MEDAGVPVSDFTDAGMATTFRAPFERIEVGFDALIADAAEKGATIAIVEIADGVFQQETRRILAKSRIRERMDAMLIAVPDALSAYGGVMMLETHGLTPFAITGKITCSPLAAAEAAQATGLPVLSREELCAPDLIAPRIAPFLRGDATAPLRCAAA